MRESVSNNIEIVWKIEGHEHYGFGKDKNLYNLKTGRRLKHSMIGYSHGWYIEGKFVTHNKIKLIRPINYKMPF